MPEPSFSLSATTDLIKVLDLCKRGEVQYLVQNDEYAHKAIRWAWPPDTPLPGPPAFSSIACLTAP